MVYSRRTILVGSLGAAAATGLAQTLRGRPDGAASILEFIPESEHAAIKARTSAYNCSRSIQRAIDATSSQGRVLSIPPGTYLLSPEIELQDEDGGTVCLAALLMRSGMHIEAEKGAVFMIRDGASTDRTPRSMGMLCTSQALSHISILGLTMDMNGTRNPISPKRSRDTYNRYNQSHILVSGTPGGQAARIDGMHIERCEFIHNPGVCCIVMAQSNSLGVRLGRGWTLLSNLFRNNGLDTDDHTAVFGWAEDVLVQNNVFENDRPFGAVGRTGGNTCYEVHGANQRLINNRFKNFMRGIWVGQNYTNPVTGTRIIGNDFQTLFFGVDFFKDRPTLTDIRDTLISGNLFQFDDTPAVRGMDLKACVQIASTHAQQDITVTNNRAVKSGTGIASAFAVVTGGGAAGKLHTNIRIEENTGTGLTFGTFIRTGVAAGLGMISARGNSWTDLTPAGIFAIAAGDNVDFSVRPQPIEKLSLGGGSVIDSRARPRSSYGIRVNATVTLLELSPGTIRGVTVARYTEDSGAAIRRRTGSPD